MPRSKNTFIEIAIVANVVAIAGACGGPRARPVNDVDAPVGPMTLLDGVASITRSHCALDGCHDTTTKSHNMDLSTAAGVFESWVDKNGLDHCMNRLRKRVIPGDPDGSFVMAKITATMPFCDLATPMPPPPLAMLSTSEIAAIRGWIAVGAPRADLIGDAGMADAGIDAEIDAPVGDALEVDGATDTTAAPDDGDPTACSQSAPCASGTTCIGEACDMRWECIAHFDDTLEHPCTDDMVPYCGCDGVTFYGSTTCPDRPYDHVGACDDGANCDLADIRCADAAPSCPEGQYLSVVSGCYGACVPIAFCRCEGAWQCPDQQKYGCYLAERRCYPYPLP